MSKFYHHRVQQETGVGEQTEVTIKCVADVVRPNFLPGVLQGEKYILVGLHCCGDLSSVLCELAVSIPEIVGIVLVPCCYHHLSEVSDFDARLENVTSQFETGLARGIAKEDIISSATDQTEETFIGFPLSNELKSKSTKLGRNSRMLACHSKKRTEASFHIDRDVRSTTATYYRALLKTIMKEHFPASLDVDGRDLRVGRIFSKIEHTEAPFVQYCRKALDKFSVPDHRDVLSDDELSQFEVDQTAAGAKVELRQYEALREMFAGPAETLIMLDKLLYLHESEKWSWVNIVQLFDPVKSPRAFAYVGYCNTE